jgi:predicted nucleotidyltransferase
LTLQKDILATIAYFDIFNYPITQTEIFLFLKNSYSNDMFQEELKELVNQGYVFKLEDFYSLQNDFSLIERRKTGNQKAKKLLEKADRVAALLAKFPYVRGIAVSGSLSKNFADDDSDIDLFIITAKNRLWIARTIMHLFKKLTFFVNKQHLFCMNYFVDEAILEIKEKNIYTAIEIATLLPLRGISTFEQFYERNRWIRSYLPNHSMKVSYVKEYQWSVFKRAVEWLFGAKPGDMLDAILMRLTSYRWRKKEKQSRKNNHGVVLSMLATRHCSKPNPAYFQNKIIVQYEHKLFNITRKIEALLKPVF